jgi:membrane protease YdiL (CAAX protease family)
MPEQPEDPVLLAFAGSMMLLSAATVVCLLVARSRGPLLKFQPRKLVPWNAAGAVLACVMVLLIIVSAIESIAAPAISTETSASSDDPSASSVAAVLAANVVQNVVLAGGFLFLIAVYFKATPRDLGLPANRQEFKHDVLIGVVAAVAAIAPVRCIQGLLLYLLGMPEMQSGHPLVKMVKTGEPNILVLILASLLAVVVAPICEEITFRLLLQGWLEKWEAKKLGVDDCKPASSADVSLDSPTADVPQIANVEAGTVIRETPTTDNSILEYPPPRGLAGLPFSWLPITISSLLFGLAHFGYGPEPVPLFFLALVLGYLYYRTHRIVPSIVAHAVFNAFTMAMLWRMAFHGVP